ncbi:drug resistance transporter, EmrB/QacA subfamily [Lentzea xinjiangensis]|uniref:Drug resistance transporter, EmrB/QacA subfamily n=1 Tax=Lentzea xinjiangensis TaxID=402600 RepID=A0A1H9MTC8_9PSEU|nr:MFS transporter [Lentzea xinjiangensis]SER26393.1 drug resistance transporter, EmrB/QacA subfamily [Lentzea xinjiangensis]
MTSTTEEAGVRPHPQRWAVLGVLCLAVMVVVLDNTVLNVAIPSISTGLGASTADIQWMINAYSLALAGLLLTTGSLSDRFGRKRALLTGLALFGVGSAVAAYATSPEALIAARGFMGVGAAVLMPGTLAVLMQLFDEKERPKAIGIWAAVTSLGFASGPVIGGALIKHFWWGSVFLINVPVAVLAIAAVAVLVPESKDPTVRKPDVVGSILSIIGMVSIVYAVIEVPEHGFGSPEFGVPVALGLVTMAAFALWERRTAEPMLDLGFFSDRRFTGAVASGVLAAFGMAGSLFLLTQHLQGVLGYSPLEAGVRVAPMAIALLVTSNTLGQLVVRLGAGKAMLLGMTIVAAGVVLLPVGTTYPPTLAGLILIGVGVGVAQPVAVNALMGAIPPERAGIASGLSSTLSELGSSFGIAVLGAVLSARFVASLPEGVPGRSLSEALHSGADVTVVREAFSTGMGVSLVIGAIAVFLGGVVASVLLRRA